jgi:hypothetical protein
MLSIIQFRPLGHLRPVFVLVSREPFSLRPTSKPKKQTERHQRDSQTDYHLTKIILFATKTFSSIKKWSSLGDHLKTGVLPFDLWTKT